MYNIIILALREFKTSVRTKSFIIGLIIAPIMMGGSILVMKLTENKVDISEKKIAVIDRTGLIGNNIIEQAELHNKNQTYDSVKGKQVKPIYSIDLIVVDSSKLEQKRIELSKMVKSKQLHAFVEIGPGVLFPTKNPELNKVTYHSENSLMDEIRDWMQWPINQSVREARIKKFGMKDKDAQLLLQWINIKGMGLVSESDSKSGKTEAKESSIVETLLIPYIFLILIFMMVLMSAVPLLSSVMEEKTERIAEVLLGTVTPFQFMMGKVLGGISISLTGMSVYVIGGVIAVSKMGYSDYIPFDLLPWFFAYTVLSIILYGSIMAALGSACNDSKDAQSLQFPAMLPIILPMFLMMPVLKEPLGSFATTLSLIPPFTPFLMIVRQASPVSVPTWQPIAGLIGVILFALLVVWLGGKIFRTMILAQGKRPGLISIIKLSMKK